MKLAKCRRVCRQAADFLNDGTFRRVGESRRIHVDVRVVICAQIWWAGAKGLRFREDLYYRLNVLTLNLPAVARLSWDNIMPLTERCSWRVLPANNRAFRIRNCLPITVRSSLVTAGG